MTPLEIRSQVLYNIFGEGTPPVSAVVRATTYLREVMREIEDMGRWWWNRRVVGGSILSSTTLADDTSTPAVIDPVLSVAGEFPELTDLVKRHMLLSIESVFTFEDSHALAHTENAVKTTYGKALGKGRMLSPASAEDGLMLRIAARTFDPDFAGDIDLAAKYTYSDPGVPTHYFFGNDVMTLHGNYFKMRVLSYPVPEQDTLYAAEVSVRTDLQFDADTGAADAQDINTKIGLALVAGGTARCASAFGHGDIAARFMSEYQDQITRLRMDNARMLCNNLMDCEYNDI